MNFTEEDDRIYGAAFFGALIIAAGIGLVLYGSYRPAILWGVFWITAYILTRIFDR